MAFLFIGVKLAPLALGTAILIGVPWCIVLAWRHEKKKDKV
jgi:hypothetical protein